MASEVKTVAVRSVLKRGTRKDLISVDALAVVGKPLGFSLGMYEELGGYEDENEDLSALSGKTGKITRIAISPPSPRKNAAAETYSHGGPSRRD